jgi:hypothetical protein
MKLNKDVVIARLEGQVATRDETIRHLGLMVSRLEDEVANLRTLFPKPESRWAQGVHPVDEGADKEASADGLLSRAAEVWGDGDAPATTVWLSKPEQKEAA